MLWLELDLVSRVSFLIAQSFATVLLDTMSDNIVHHLSEGSCDCLTCDILAYRFAIIMKYFGVVETVQLFVVRDI